MARAELVYGRAGHYKEQGYRHAHSSAVRGASLRGVCWAIIEAPPGSAAPSRCVLGLLAPAAEAAFLPDMGREGAAARPDAGLHARATESESAKRARHDLPGVPQVVASPSCAQQASGGCLFALLARHSCLQAGAARPAAPASVGATPTTLPTGNGRRRVVDSLAGLEVAGRRWRSAAYGPSRGAFRRRWTQRPVRWCGHARLNPSVDPRGTASRGE